MRRSEQGRRKEFLYFSLMEKHYSKMNEINKGKDPKKAAKAVQNELERKKKEIQMNKEFKA